MVFGSCGGRSVEVLFIVGMFGFVEVGWMLGMVWWGVVGLWVWRL
jgi:hypothetical protein